MRAAQAAAEEHARQLDIAGIAGAAYYLGDAVHALNWLAHGLAAQPRCLHADHRSPIGRSVTSECIGRVHHGK
jgi:hypothetical protein